jgi:hypothetical protein
MSCGLKARSSPPMGGEIQALRLLHFYSSSFGFLFVFRLRRLASCSR